MDWKFGDEAVPLKRDLDDGGLRSGVMTYIKKKADRRAYSPSDQGRAKTWHALTQTGNFQNIVY